MEHSFDIEVAKQTGVNCAIILHHLYFWISKNIANETNYYDGKYWTYSSVKALEELFPYLTGKQIRSCLKKLADEGIIVTGNYNRSAYDRTTWYAITEKGFSILHIGDFHLPKWENGSSEKGEPIPDNNTDNIKDNIYNSDSENKKANIENFFNSIWKAYPKKKGKGDISDARKKKLYENVGLEQMLRCIERYKEYTSGEDEKYIMYGGTFFNSGYIDYLDDNYEQQECEEDNLPFK